MEKATRHGLVARADLDPDREDGRQREQRAVLRGVAQHVELGPDEIVDHARVARRLLEPDGREPRRETRVSERPEQGPAVQALHLFTYTSGQLVCV